MISTFESLPDPPNGKTGWPWTEARTNAFARMENRKKWPKISIVTPSYNQGKFIEESIRSVLLQGYPNLEFILIDAQSTDETRKIIEKYSDWIDYWESRPDRGQSHAINKGLALCSGDYFNWHNADDVLFPGTLFKTVSLFLQHADMSFIFGNYVTIDENGKIISETKGSLGTFDRIYTFKEGVQRLKVGAQPGCLMDCELVKRLGGCDENMHFVMDVDLQIRMLFYKPAFYTDTPLVFLRSHDATKSNKRTSQRAKERIFIAKKIFSQHHQHLAHSTQLRRKAFSVAYRYAIRWFIESDCFCRAAFFILRLWLISPYENKNSTLLAITSLESALKNKMVKLLSTSKNKECLD